MTQTSDAFGSLTALFTSDAPSSTEAESAAPGAPVLVVLVGNLPVMAGLWTTQLADEIARHGGPTGLVRFERGEVTVELLRAEGRTLPPPSPDAVVRWLPRGAALLRRWVICVPAETAPAEVLGASGEILLMTGADEAAVVHAYHRLKHLADEASHRGEPLVRAGLVVVGATDERVEAVAAKLGEAARSFLGLELTVVARLPKLGRVETSARVAYPSSEAPAFVEFMPALEHARANASSRFDAEPRPVQAIDHAVEHASAERGSGAPASATPASTGIPVPSNTRRATEAPAPAPVPAAASALIPESAPAPASGPMSASVAQRVAHAAPRAGASPARLLPLLDGVRPLGISCPTVPEVELALDADGRLQIIGRAEQLARIRAAHTWAVQHQQLLGIAFPELARRFVVVERIVVDDARQAIPLHGSGVLLDLLVQVKTPGGPVTAVVPLNDAATAG